MNGVMDGREQRLRAGVSWRRERLGRGAPPTALAVLAVPVVLAAALTTMPVGGQAAGTTSTAASVRMIVREAPGAGSGPEQVLAAVGGSKGRRLAVINGYTAEVPASRAAALRRAPGVLSVTPDSTVHLAGTTEPSVTGRGSMYQVAKVTGAATMWDRGFTGEGVDVAVIDSGVVPVDGLRGPAKVVHGPDLSLESVDCTSQDTCEASPAQHLDSYGHGTHVAGIIAGRDDAAPAQVRSGATQNFLGMAPDARIVSVKVADAWGAADVSQVIGAIEWVVRNRRSDGLDIRVLNLSFGTDGVQDYVLDPLTAAAETAWHEGIVVVVSAGNRGYGSAKLNNPAYDPYVIAVGAANTQGTDDVSDDVVPAWSSTGDGTRNPDLVAPGSSLLSLRDPGSFIDTAHPTARVDGRFFRGSGTSQAGAVVSGAVALLIEQRPRITPDQVKELLTRTARSLPAAAEVAQGAGLVDLARAAGAQTPFSARQRWVRAQGTGSLEGARGTHHITLDGRPFTGDYQEFRDMRVSGNWADYTWAGHTWNGQSWQSAGWTLGDGGLGDSIMSGRAWSGRAWSGRAWSGRAWSSVLWQPLAAETP